jgi:hypothetical protein
VLPSSPVPAFDALLAVAGVLAVAGSWWLLARRARRVHVRTRALLALVGRRRGLGPVRQAGARLEATGALDGLSLVVTADAPAALDCEDRVVVARAPLVRFAVRVGGVPASARVPRQAGPTRSLILQGDAVEARALVGGEEWGPDDLQALVETALEVGRSA